MREVKSFLCVIVITLSAIVLIYGAAFAADGDIPIELTFEDGSNAFPLGTGFLRGDDLWVPADAMRRMGVSLRDGPNGKGFMIDVQNPADVFGIPQIAKLAGNILPMYFSSLVENGSSYFNIIGMEQITNIAVIEKNEGVVFHRLNDEDKFLSESPKPANKKIMGKLSLVWINITRDNPYLEGEEKINGLDVILPTWFNLMDGDGNMANRASSSYVEAAHKKGYSVWAMLSNGFNKVNTTQFFNNPMSVNLFIARILAYSKLYGLDGINIDFENVDVNDRASFVRFISLLGPYLRAYGLKSSIDVHVPGNSNLSRSHDRGRLAKYVDYIILMAYDEHWRTAPKAGSVASMPWVERAVQNTLAEGVPQQKLVLGVPFYMRKWEETSSGDGKVKVRSYTLTMRESDEIIRSKGLSPVWFSDLGQHFYSYSENGKTYKIWVENEDSVSRKLQLVNKYSLAGTAAWRKGYEKPEIWPVIKNILGK